MSVGIADTCPKSTGTAAQGCIIRPTDRATAVVVFGCSHTEICQ